MTREQLDALQRALREVEAPDAGPARERARRTVLAVHAEARRRRRARPAAPLAWAALAAVLAALCVTQRDSGPAQAVERLVRDIVHEPAATHAPTPASALALPTAGRLLVSGSDGLFAVARSGKRTPLGHYDGATWSPRGRYVGATNGRSLVALDASSGALRWRIQPDGNVSLPRWAPDGTHIAYRAGHTLRIVYGNGIHDVRAGEDMAAVAPAWRPGADPVVAWASTAGTVTVEHAETAKVLWRHRGGPVQQLAWSADGRKLLIAGRYHGAIYDLATGRTTRLELGAGEELLAAAYAPRGTRLALAVAVGGGTRTAIRIHGSVLFSGDGRLTAIEWSPDGRWLLAQDPTAGEWLIAHASGRATVSAVAVERRFGSGARTHGWCC